MAYLCELSPSQKVYLDVQANQTVVTTVTSSPGQQQQSSSSFTTGSWTFLPVIYRTDAGIVIEIETAQGKHYVNVQGNSMGVMNDTPSITQSERLQLQQVSSIPNATMSPMKPMEPMKMQPMKMQPMQMRMGNLEMQMNSTSESSSSQTRQFCSQCGASIKPEDRFCSSCGYRLDS
ncbi:zinc ribbon domain-containing protein [Limnoraphis robusta]|uniref:Zinc ribbon domain-containing protein n=1 Tax=Limnoraphis robusta CCNP1315 TaxID=3110306 RepID=A0ABU5U165_9CYAN|nr:zinc ribbon domain-containing protein [Limnoraphis robusta]MEA5497135.1 zinc ribbon domain-containing protein [Limnoraphis robusta BA-68 BA1]MEA5520662.1 zinc ribbon domain-containing protein [Limnoraphis robusta CCNP1315]MEA5545640.1 zinc ribbon domain-containing protein [Limnoraphis robusta CCNP1324]